MNQEEHEKVTLQMLKEIKARGAWFSGGREHVLFLRKNAMITTQGIAGFKSGRPRYKLTAHGEGLLHHLLTKYEGVTHADVKDGSGCAPGGTSGEGDAGKPEGGAGECQREPEGSDCN